MFSEKHSLYPRKCSIQGELYVENARLVQQWISSSLSSFSSELVINCEIEQWKWGAPPCSSGSKAINFDCSLIRKMRLEDTLHCNDRFFFFCIYIIHETHTERCNMCHFVRFSVMFCVVRSEACAHMIGTDELWTLDVDQSTYWRTTYCGHMPTMFPQ